MNNQWTFEFHGDLQSTLVFLAFMAVIIAITVDVVRRVIGWQVTRHFEKLLAPFIEKAEQYRSAARAERDPVEKLRLRSVAAEYDRVIAELRNAR